jgi:cyclophilin family peptidyl-prolyl cis-trans isomerase
MMAIMTSCGEESSSEPETTTATPTTTKPRSDKPVGFQFEKPAVGEEIVVLHTEMGDIRLRLFPVEAPLAVENFLGLVKKGYYDGVKFHRVIDNFMIQSGDPLGTGSGGESIWGKGFGVEANANLLHFRGALSMANTGQPDSNGSQFFIVQSKTATGLNESAYPKAAVDLYKEKGGYSSLDGGYSVFGQAFAEDLSVVDKIAAIQVPGDEAGTPSKKVKITKAEIVKYTGK